MATKTIPIEQFSEHLEGLYLSDTAIRILTESDTLDPSLGLKIFLDRYSKKAKRETASKGDLIMALVKDGKWPKKQIGIIVEDRGETVVSKLLTGDGDAEAGSLFENLKKHISIPIESVKDTNYRVAKANASVENTKGKKDYWGPRFFNQLMENKIQPAGRIMTGAISPEDYNSEEDGQLTLFNCYVIPSPHDSRGGIMQTLLEMTEIMSRGGGVGINLSTLRPKRAYVKGVRGESSGSVSWGGLYSYTTGLIEQGGSRRGALMLMIHDWHPDLMDFISSKEVKGQIENANISVLVSNGFMDAVKNDEYWTTCFPDTKHPNYDKEWDGDLKKWIGKGYPIDVYKTYKARDIWNKIIKSAWKSAEPGVVFHERYNDMSNSWYFNPIICTNPCGEQGLPAWGVCNLTHINLGIFYHPVNQVDWDALGETIDTTVRFLDNIIDLTPYHFEQNKENQMNERRVGMGTLGIAELFIRNQIKYGSFESLVLADKVNKFIAERAYIASSNLAKERGSFIAYNKDKFAQSGFMKMMAIELPHVTELIYNQGMRNVTVITQAPTGSVGSMLGTSTGIEPYFAFEYHRQSRLGFDKILVPLAQEFMLPDGSLPNYFIDANQLSPQGHIEIQGIIQKWCDSSISKTCNVPAEFTVDQTAELYLYAFELGCKGVTIYRDGSRDEQVLHLIKEEVVVEEKKFANELTFGFNLGDKCGNCREGIIMKFDGCTKCSSCDYQGSCDMK